MHGGCAVLKRLIIRMVAHAHRLEHLTTATPNFTCTTNIVNPTIELCSLMPTQCEQNEAF